MAWKKGVMRHTHSYWGKYCVIGTCQAERFMSAEDMGTVNGKRT